MGPLQGPIAPEPEADAMPMLTALDTMWPGWSSGPVESWEGETQSKDIGQGDPDALKRWAPKE